MMNEQESIGDKRVRRWEEAASFLLLILFALVALAVVLVIFT